MPAIALLGALALGPASSSAGYKFERSFGGTGTTNGKFESPQGIADPFFGPIWVVDDQRNDLQIFNGDGSFLAESPGFGASINRLERPVAVAGVIAGPDGGDAYVADEQTSRIEEFDSTGQTVSIFGGQGTGNGKLMHPNGVAVSPISPYNVYVADTVNQRIEEFSAHGNFIRTFGGSRPGMLPRSVAIGPNGGVWVADTGNGLVLEFGANGGFIRSFQTAFPTGIETPIDLALDSEGYLYVAGLSGDIGKFTKTGFFIDTIGASGPHQVQFGVSLDVSSYEGIETVAILDAVDRVRLFDAAPPNTKLVSGPNGRATNDPTPTFTFSSTESSSTFECERLPATTYTKCGATHTFAHLADGSYVVYVRAVDSDKLRDTTPLVLSFAVDTVPPQTMITSGPSGDTSDSTPSFGFSADDGGTKFKCAVDSASATNCTSPHQTATLVAGPHTFSVFAIDEAGNADATPATRSFNVTSGAPDTTITSGPGLTNDPTPTFGFTSTVPGSTFECELDTLGFGACTNPFTFTALPDGTYSFSVRASSGSSTDASPATRSFTVDTTPPTTTITGGPSGGTQNRTPKFKFTSNDPAATFECKLDSGNYAACISPDQLTQLSFGNHTFKVRASDAAGNVDPNPAKQDFTVNH